jgi:CBS domain-containing protein
VKISSTFQRSDMSCMTDDSVERAAQLMWEHDIGCLPVTDGFGHIAGVLTDRDVCITACTQSVPLRTIPVANVMTKVTIMCGEGDEVDAVERMMSEHQIGRMPVADQAGRPIGVVTRSDIARAGQGR